MPNSTMSNELLMNQENDVVTPGSYQINWEAKTISRVSAHRSANISGRSRHRRNRRPVFVIPSLPEFVPPSIPNNVIKIRDPNIPRVILPPPKFFEGPKITWPDVDNFCAVYLGTDENNRVILKFNDEKSKESYEGSRSVWGVFHVTLGKDAKLGICDLEVGLLVIASHKIQGKDHFYRAKVLSIQEEKKTALVRNVDEWEDMEVSEENLYWMNNAFLNIHFQAIVCELRELNFFNGTPIIKQIMNDSLQPCFPLKSVVRVSQFEARHPYPVLNFSGWPLRPWKNTVNAELKNIMKVWRPQIPSSGGIFCQNILVTHANELGNIWLQTGTNLTHFLTQLRLEELQNNNTEENPPDSEDEECGVSKSIERGEMLFLGQFMDEYYYRCRVLKFLPEDKLATVEFVDFGNSCTIKTSEMLTYETFFGEEGGWVKFIKPQCVKAHLNGIDIINLDSFWDQVGVDKRQDIMKSFVQRRDRITPQVELFNYPNGDGEKHHLNKFFLRNSSVARNIGGRKIGANMRIPGTKTFLRPELVTSFEADMRKPKGSHVRWIQSQNYLESDNNNKNSDSDTEDSDFGLQALFDI